jgi:hypothetical protein
MSAANRLGFQVLKPSDAIDGKWADMSDALGARCNAYIYMGVSASLGCRPVWRTAGRKISVEPKSTVQKPLQVRSHKVVAFGARTGKVVQLESRACPCLKVVCKASTVE